jgi:hypothetical protein
VSPINARLAMLVRAAVVRAASGSVALLNSASGCTSLAASAAYTGQRQGE